MHTNWIEILDTLPISEIIDPSVYRQILFVLPCILYNGGVTYRFSRVDCIAFNQTSESGFFIFDGFQFFCIYYEENEREEMSFFDMLIIAHTTGLSLLTSINILDIT